MTIRVCNNLSLQIESSVQQVYVGVFTKSKLLQAVCHCAIFVDSFKDDAKRRGGGEVQLL